MKQDGDDKAGAAGHWVVAVLAPGSILLAVTVEFLSFHNYSLVLPESLLLMGAALAAGGLLGVASLVWPASQPMLMALALALFISRFSLFELFNTWFGRALSGMLGAPDILAVFYVVLIVASSAVCLLVRKHLAIIITVAFGTIIASSAIFPAGTKAVALRTAAGGPELKDLPPVIHVILDGQIGIGGLLPDIADARQAADMMKQVYRDFEVHERGYSLFTRTEDSVTALMNGELSAGVEALLDRTGGARRMRTNKWFDQLRSRGYAIRVYQSDWLDMCRGSAAVSHCYTYSLHPENVIQRTSLTTGQRLSVLAMRILNDKAPNLFAPVQLTPLPSVETLNKVKAEIAERPRGVAHIVHLLLPHEGYLYSADCTLLPPDKWQDLYVTNDKGGLGTAGAAKVREKNYREYLQQMMCTTRLMDGLFGRLRQLQIYDQATIIVHGDHGSRVTGRSFLKLRGEMMSDRDVLDLHSTLIAIKAPGIRPGVKLQPVSVQALFARQFLGVTGRADAPAADEVLMRNPDKSFTRRRLVWPE